MHKLLLGIAASTLFVTGAMAADLNPAPAPTYNSAAFDWNGFYAGLGVSGVIFPSANLGLADIIAGVNVTSGKMLFGLKGRVGLWSDTIPQSGYAAGVDVRLGYLVTPDVVFYLSGGGVYLYHTGGLVTTYGTLGAGAEFAVANNVSFDVEYRHWIRTGGALTGNGLSASVLWHF